MAEITWIKLKTDMFENEKIKLIEALPDADTIIVIWVKLLATAGKANSNGYIMLTENIPMNEEEMATIFNRPLNTVRLALQTFKRYGMIEVDNEAIRIKNWEMHQNIDGMEKVRLQNRMRKRKQREREKQQQLPSHVMSRDSHATEGEGDIDIDIEGDIDKEKEGGIEEEKKQTQTLPPHPSLIDNEFINIQKYYEQHVIYQQASFRENQKLSDMLDDYRDHLLIIEAMKIAVERGKPRISYINGILNGWYREDGITNYKQLVAHRKRGEQNGTTQQNAPRDDGKESRIQETNARRAKLLRGESD